MFKNLTLGMILFLLVGAVYSQEEELRTFSWIPPTERTDGTSLSSDEIQKYELGCSTESGQYDVLTFDAPGGTNTSVQIPDSYMLPGVNYCSARTVDTDGNRSAWADEVTWINVAPPTDLGGGIDSQ